MNVWDAYRETVTAQIYATEKFTLVIPGFVKDVHIAPSGPDTDLFDRWELRPDSEKGVFNLWVWKGEELLAICTLDQTGEWSGRFRPKNGYLTLRPNDNSRWRKLKDIQKFTQNYPVVDGIPEFYYREIPNIDQLDISSYEWDISEKVEAEPSEYAIALVGCNRPTYFTQVVDALALNDEAHEYPLFCFLDLPEVKIDHQFQSRQSAYLLERFPDAVVIKRTENWGCGRNLIDVRRQLFDKLHYPNVFVFEDDMLPSPTYIKFCTNMFEWAKGEYGNIGAVQGWIRSSQTREEKEKNLTVVAPTFSNWWGYCMSRECWDSISDDMYAYEAYFLSQKYAQRPNDSIKEYFRLMLQEKDERPNSLLLTDDKYYERQRYFERPPTGQDSATMHFFDKRGWLRLAPIVNRSCYIGKHGIHMNEHLWKSHRYDELTYDEFADDDKIVRFTMTAVEIEPDLDYIAPGIYHV